MSNQKTPRVLDRAGNELSFGSPVTSERWGHGEVTGVSIFTPNKSGATLLVVMADDQADEMHWHAEAIETPNVFCCPDLLLIETPSTEPKTGENE